MNAKRVAIQYFLSWALPWGVMGHGSMFEPPSRNSGGMSLLAPTCAGGACQWYSQGCTIGCPQCSGRYSAEPDCANPAEPTLKWGEDDYLLQYHTDGHGANTTYFPWRYPGAAPIMDSCGIAGGGIPPFGQLDPPPGHPAGSSGSDTAHAPKLLEQTTWVAGSTVEVAWGIAANHGGGYQYRLCPERGPLTEECFTSMPLEFVGDKQWIRFDNGNPHTAAISRVREIPAVRVSGDKVLPVNSTWTKNPIAGCKINGAREKLPCLGPTMVPPLLNETFLYGGGAEPGLYGFGGGHCMGNVSRNASVRCTDMEYGNAVFNFVIVDLVKVPEHIPPGNYVISFRWDCEQTKQIWSSCGDVTIKGPDTPAAGTKPFSALRGCTPCCAAKGGLCANCTRCVDDRTGDCAYCWKPLEWWGGRQYWSPRASHIQCLGYEASDGGASTWMPGQPISVWSPGCPKCWALDDGCAMHVRDLEQYVSETPTLPDVIDLRIPRSWMLQGSGALLLAVTGLTLARRKIF